MSMVGLALRMSAVRALQHDDTLADDRIFDSALLPIDQMLSDQPRPFVMISTDNAIGNPSGRDVNNGDNEIDFLIEIALARVGSLPGKDEDGEDIAIEVAQTDATLEVGLALMRRQVFGCLFGRGGGIWGDVFRAFTSSLTNVIEIRGGNLKDGARYAGRQIVITIKAIAEPAFGPIQQGTPWEKFIAALEADAALADLAKIIKSGIEGIPLGWPETYTAAAVLGGYTDAEGEAIGLSSFAPASAGETEVATVAVVYPAGWEIDEAAIDEQFPPEPP